MRSKLLCSLILCLGGAAGACSQATGADQADQPDSQATETATVELALTGLT